MRAFTSGRLKDDEPSGRGSPPNEQDASLSLLLFRWSAVKGMLQHSARRLTAMFVPVVDHDQQPLMPTTPARARRWIRGGKATAFWKGGLFCVRLNVEPSAREIQPVACGIDPGSKKEGLGVASAAHTYIHRQADSDTWVTSADER